MSASISDAVNCTARSLPTRNLLFFGRRVCGVVDDADDEVDVAAVAVDFADSNATPRGREPRAGRRGKAYAFAPSLRSGREGRAGHAARLVALLPLLPTLAPVTAWVYCFTLASDRRCWFAGTAVDDAHNNSSGSSMVIPSSIPSSTSCPPPPPWLPCAAGVCTWPNGDARSSDNSWPGRRGLRWHVFSCASTIA